MKPCVVTRSWLGVASWLGILGTIAISVSDRAAAQIVPDASLGAEGSTVIPNTVIRGVTSDLRVRGAGAFGLFTLVFSYKS